jgi:hypothetical protein
MARSGTTLLDKLISLHSDAIVLSQPLPLLYVALKKEFLIRTHRLHAVSSRYPLNDLLSENYYPAAELEDFLNTFRMTREFVRDVLLRQASYDGQYHKPERPLAVLNGFDSDLLAPFLNRYVDFYSTKPAAFVRGSKEPTCEEFVPYLLGQNVRVIFLIRDPRDVLASLNFGAGHRYVGRRKPLLFDVRQWRKSVAFALALEGHESVLVTRYEDLVTNSTAEMSRLMSFLGLDETQSKFLSGMLVKQSGEVWRGNSSHFEFDGVSDRSVGHYRSCLTRRDDLFVQSLCYAELKRLAYPVEITNEEIPEILSRYAEERALEREELAPYQWAPIRQREELARWHALVKGEINETLFPLAEAFRQLRAAT